ncbi:ubiquitin carboxyl-terminal hydrolase 50 [Engystomops pustulosus]|uniref:ubiquitin carboxyl-terminal hydrolase 50 n=1 Tax=Engystomops pustulosus TaxID=76066 RepID=UPI003AFB744D
MDVTVATLIWAQWASEDYSTVGIVTSSCTLCGRCFTLKHGSKTNKYKRNEFGKSISQAPSATKHLFLQLFDEQILGQVQKKVNRNIRRLKKIRGHNLVKVEQDDLLKWVGNLLSSGFIGLHGKPTKESVSISTKKYYTFSSQQQSQDWFCLFSTEGNKNVSNLFSEIDQLQEQLGINIRTNYDPTQVLSIEKYKINFKDPQYPSDLRVVLLVEKETGYICNFYIYSLTQVLKKSQCIPFLYVIRKLLNSFYNRNYTVEIDSSAYVEEATIEEFSKRGIKLQLVSKPKGKYGSLYSKENHIKKTLRDYVKLSFLTGHSIFPVYGRDFHALSFLVVFWLLVYFSCINAFILYLLEDVECRGDISLREFGKLLAQEILGNNFHSDVAQWEESTSDEDLDTDDTKCETKATTSNSKILHNDLPMKVKGVTGLCNLGNTCYMNAVIQCLSCTTPLVEYFFSWQFEKFIARDKKELSLAFANLISLMWFGKEQEVSPIAFLSVMCKVHPPFRKDCQQDSHELLIYTLNALHEDITNKKSPSANAGSSSTVESNAAESLISRLLQGVLKQNTACLECGHTSHKEEVFTVLSLPIVSADETNVQDCLEGFFQQVILTRTDRIFCPVCKLKQDASAKAQIWKLPKILILHLKRFEYKGCLKRKLKTNVEFPMKNLDLSPFVSPLIVKQQKYKLYAIVNHSGELDFGHYTAFCKHPGTKEWNAFDDTRCFKISESMVQTSSAYILFYTSQKFSFPKKTSSSTACC